MKFKVGDKVVRISTESTYRLTNKDFDEGDFFVVETIRDFGSGDLWVYPDYGETGKLGVRESELELESVYNSKLYKALK